MLSGMANSVTGINSFHVRVFLLKIYPFLLNHIFFLNSGLEPLHTTRMDKELLRQREAFKKRALAQPTVEKRKLKTRDDDEVSTKKHKSSSKPKGTELVHLTT